MKENTYRVIELLGEEEHYSFCRAAMDDLKTSCLIKKPVGGADSSGWDRLFHEYDICSRLDVQGVLRPLEKNLNVDSPVIILEDPGGPTLGQLLRDKPLSLDLFFPVAIELSEIIGRLHLEKIIHKDIHPGNVVLFLNHEDPHVFLTGFGLAKSFSDQALVTSAKKRPEGTLSIMSPEQTGRINRVVDYRTDFYSLGVVMYHMLAGSFPFNFDSSIEMVYAHLAKEPPDLIEINEDVPGMIARLIAKLLSKDADDRYHSTRGIVADLKRCWTQWQRQNKIDDFELGKEDVARSFIYPGKLYGRDEEYSRLDSIFQRVCGGGVEMVLISGAAGIGKTTLVNNLRTSIGQRNGYLMKGKSDPMSHTPYISFVHAISDGVDQLLMQPPQIVERVKHTWLNILGKNARVLTDSIPALKAILGELPPIPELPAEQGRNRFHNAVQKMLSSAISLRGRPIVLFLDDLQWVDLQTIKLLEVLCCDQDQRNLLLVGTCRDDEIDEDHALSAMKNNIVNGGGKLSEIALKPLEVSAIEMLIDNALQLQDNRGGFLAEICRKKTGGNPFFVRQFISEMVDSGSVYFDLDNNCWNWRKEHLERSEVAENVVDYLAAKLQGFDQNALKMLESASCIGTVFDLETIKHIHNLPLQQCLDTLWPAVSEQYITLVPTDKQYFVVSKRNGSQVPPQLIPDIDGKIVRFTFVHDRFNEAAYNQLAPEERLQFHLRIGRYWQMSRKQPGLTESLHDILGQLNRTVPLLTNFEEKKELALLNLHGGLLAQEKSHFETAFEYFKTGINLLGERGWQEAYAETRDLYGKGTQAAFLAGHYDELHQWYTTLKQNAAAPIDCVDGYIALIQKEMTQHNLRQGISYSLEILALLGITFPVDPTAKDFMLELNKTESMLSSLSSDEIIGLPQMENEEDLAVAQVIFAVISACYLADRFLHHLLILKLVQLNLAKGVGKYSSMIFGTLGFMLNVFPDKVKEVARYGEIGLGFAKKFIDENTNVRTDYLYYMGVAPLKIHLREAIKGLERDLRKFLELGNFVQSGNTHFVIEHMRFVQGLELEKLVDLIATSLKALEKIRHQAARMILLPLQQMIFNFLGRSEHTTKLVGDAFDERSLNWDDSKNETFLASVKQCKMILAYHFGRFEEAERLFLELESSGYQVNIPPLFAQSIFFGALSSLALSAGKSAEQLDLLLEKTGSYQEGLRKFAESAPMNFAHMYHLITAERARVSGDNGGGEEFYGRAIEDAKTNGYLNDEALANELAAKFFLGTKKKIIGQMFMQRALDCYMRWGARAKVEFLRQQYPDLVGGEIDTQVLEAEYVAKETSQQDFDLMSGLRASRAISGEVELNRLLETLMAVVMENLGATKGCFLLEKDGNLVLSAVADAEQSVAITHRSEPVELRETSDSMPLQIVNSVCHTREMTVLDDAREDDLFGFDPYIQQKQPRAILCTPLIRKERLVGVLYLENNLLSGAFSKDKLQMVEILSAQIGVSLENAIFYEEKLKAEAALFSEKERLAVTLKSIGEGVITTDIHGTITLLNTAAEELTGWLSREAEEKPLQEVFTIIGESGVSLWDDLLPEVLQSNSPAELPENTILVTKIGIKKTITASSSPIHDSGGHTIGTVVVFKDVTEKRQLEERILQAQKMEAIGSLAGGIAHDFNNILSPVIGYSEILLKEIEHDEKIREALLRIYQAGVRGRDVVKQILLLGRKQQKKMVPVRLQEIIQEVEHLCSSMLPASIELILDVDWGCRPVLADATQIHQVLMNLVANAKHAITTNIGQIVIRLHEMDKEPIAPETLGKSKQNFVLMSVEDSGCGMSSKVRKKIFDPYFTTRESDKGTGLGLATTHGIVQEHNGYIEVESTEGEGSIFRIMLPALSIDVKKFQSENKKEKELIGLARVLFVDDEPAVASLGQRILEKLGYTVTISTDSVKALELFQKDPDAFDLVITDMTLPKMTGDILAQKISSVRPDIPIIACTGYSERLVNLPKETNPFIDSLQKPFTGDELGKVVKKALTTKL